jgi:hypothetical protein
MARWQLKIIGLSLVILREVERLTSSQCPRSGWEPAGARRPSGVRFIISIYKEKNICIDLSAKGECYGE